MGHNMKTLFYIEITDTFGGDANYSWVTRHAIYAKSERGAIWKLSRNSGMNWHCVSDYGDSGKRYDSKSGATCAFVEWFDTERFSDYRFSTDERAS